MQAGCGRVATTEGNFRTTSVNSYPLPQESNLTQARVAAEKDRARAVYLNNPTAKNEATYFETEKGSSLFAGSEKYLYQ